MPTSPTLSVAAPRLGAAIVCLGACALMLLAGQAEARDRSGSATGPQGNTANRSVSRAQGDVSSSTTGPNGRVASRNVDRSPDSTSAIVAGPNGRTATRNTTRTGSGSQTTVTGPNGQTGAITVSR
jgi:hypothetical protein